MHLDRRKKDGRFACGEDTESLLRDRGDGKVEGADAPAKEVFNLLMNDSAYVPRIILN